MGWLKKLFTSDKKQNVAPLTTQPRPRYEAEIIADYCRQKLDLTELERAEPDPYRSLPLCVIDAVYSINANYTAVKNVVDRFCKHFNLKPTSAVFPPKTNDQLSVTDFLRLYDKYGVEGMVNTVFQNKQRTSTRNGILKAEAVWHFSRVLNEFGVNYVQDMYKVVGQPAFETAIRKIPGQGSGKSMWYFYMLSGSENYVKPDRMISRFIASATGKTLGMEATHEALVAACRQLQSSYPKITPRRLDNLIWKYQREQGGPE